MLCEYGCGNVANFKLRNGKYCCENHHNKCPAIRQKNSEGLKKAYKEGKLNAKEIYKNKSQSAKERMNWNKNKCLIDLKNVFVKNSRYRNDFIRRYILNLKLKEYKCSECGIENIYNGKEIILELHHIDGNHKNNELSNLTFLCPNCHSQTHNFRNKNPKRSEYLTDKEYYNALINCNSIHEASLSLGISGAGNYKRFYRIISEHKELQEKFLQLECINAKA